MDSEKQPTTIIQVNTVLDAEQIRNCHEKAADHFQKAAECHREAIKHCNTNNQGNEKEMIYALKAMGHTVCGLEEAKKLARHCINNENI